MLLEVSKATHTGADAFGRAIVEHVDFRWAALAALILIIAAAVKCKLAGKELTLAASLEIAIGVISAWSCLIIGAILLLEDPPNLSSLAPDTARMIGLITVIVLVASSSTAIRSGFK